jgi:hypothetical protein
MNVNAITTTNVHYDDHEDDEKKEKETRVNLVTSVVSAAVRATMNLLKKSTTTDIENAVQVKMMEAVVLSSVRTAMNVDLENENKQDMVEVEVNLWIKTKKSNLMLALMNSPDILFSDLDDQEGWNWMLEQTDNVFFSETESKKFVEWEEPIHTGIYDGTSGMGERKKKLDKQCMLHLSNWCDKHNCIKIMRCTDCYFFLCAVCEGKSMKEQAGIRMKLNKLRLVEELKLPFSCSIHKRTAHCYKHFSRSIWLVKCYVCGGFICADCDHLVDKELPLKELFRNRIMPDVFVCQTLPTSKEYRSVETWKRHLNIILVRNYARWMHRLREKKEEHDIMSRQIGQVDGADDDDKIEADGKENGKIAEGDAVHQVMNLDIENENNKIEAEGKENGKNVEGDAVHQVMNLDIENEKIEKMTKNDKLRTLHPIPIPVNLDDDLEKKFQNHYNDLT